ncbi:pyrroline-5-carboxylate reductase [Legionella micdadei]|uniref:Pyrroline-5-carboxylate reductase n=1 Tax=Legionella micdadei TaxID=451 RepID=A0A098GIS6_LEGMI|nr:pyrroline-5-carboxylate reductase [Legionella micdadei]ARG96718.1 pyrroline-5-carboxylate reductase [Legionella micdadei]KTD26383.1 pyrroline-5-carboxylate reductase [Legionella micdadei]NSL19041.1 pyrroline-5-carboxylate reductase [Legionella micdadei]CEG61902.1 Pyrroline-5-carboxylate reductase [Legionella micdadei]SCY66527.1 pyrroline-5-carboxylate reductase [Legionella micdadei]
MNIHFIGFGNMAKAIAHSLCSQGKTYQITAASPSLREGKTPEGILTHPDNSVGVKNADLVILAVKPVQMATVLNEIREDLPKHCLLISVAAGLSLAWLEQHCRQGQPIIRSMPNIAITIGKGATPLIANQFVSQEQKRIAEELFNSSGIISWTSEEKDIDAFTALSGSGPAYVFFFLESMIDAAKQLGLTEEIAKTFTLQTVIGALGLVSGSNLEIKELRKKVTSPAGTTAAAIDILEQHGFAELLFKAMEAAYERAKQLGSSPML